MFRFPHARTLSSLLALCVGFAVPPAGAATESARVLAAPSMVSVPAQQEDDAQLPARPERTRDLDGTGPEILDMVLARREWVREMAERAPKTRGFGAANIAVLEDDGTMVVGNVTVFERITQAFYSSFPDSFDIITIFVASDFPGDVEPEAGFAFEFNVRNDVAGIGLQVGLDANAGLGIDTQLLKSVLNMNDIPEYPSPTAAIPGFPNSVTGVEVLGQEAGHMMASFVNIDAVVPNADILGRGESHWSLFLDSEASVLEGCRWQDNGNGTFTSIETFNGFSQLDEYLLGLRAPADVDPMWVIDSNDMNDATFPNLGFNVTGTRIDFTIADVVAQNGARVPDASSSQKEFRIGFILVIPNGAEPLQSDLDFLNLFRSEWESFFFAETEGLGTMNTNLAQAPVSADFSVDKFAGNAPLTVQFTSAASGTVEDVVWDFGDGNGSTARNPVHTYTTDGTYTVTLTVNGFAGPAVEVKPDLVQVGGFQTLVQEPFEGLSTWTVGAPNDATTGNWELGDPVGTTSGGLPAQPENDHTPGAGTRAWVTGLAGGAAGAADVDNGTTTLYSEIFDLSTATDPLVCYARWYTNNLGSAPGQDEFVVQVSSNGGAGWVDLERLNLSDTEYNLKQWRISDFVTPTSAVQFRFQASDLGAGSLVEAVIDDFEILDTLSPAAAPELAAVAAGLHVQVLPNPSSRSAQLRFELPAREAVTLAIFDLNGRRVRTLAEGTYAAGAHRVSWDGMDDRGGAVASGIYYARVTTASESHTVKVHRLH